MREDCLGSTSKKEVEIGAAYRSLALDLVVYHEYENKYQFYVFRCLAFSPTFLKTGFRSYFFGF